MAEDASEIRAAQAQLELDTHTCFHVTANEPYIELAERLGALCPFLEEPQVFFCNSGAEAVDGALKLARRATGRGGVIAFRRGFHGRTLAATSLTTAKGRYREAYEPLLPGVYVAPYGDVPGALDALDELLELEAVGANIGAMVVEPVLGEGWTVVLADVRRLPRPGAGGRVTHCFARATRTGRRLASTSNAVPFCRSGFAPGKIKYVKSSSAASQSPVVVGSSRISGTTRALVASGSQ